MESPSRKWNVGAQLPVPQWGHCCPHRSPADVSFLSQTEQFPAWLCFPRSPCSSRNVASVNTSCRSCQWGWDCVWSDKTPLRMWGTPGFWAQREEEVTGMQGMTKAKPSLCVVAQGGFGVTQRSRFQISALRVWSVGSGRSLKPLC